MENTQKKGKYTYFWNELEFSLEIPLYWEQIYRGQPREKLYDSYTVILEQLKKVTKDRICLDIGVNHGIFSVPASLLGYEVVGFEPVKANFEDSVNNMAINDCKNFHLFNYALSNKNEEVDIFVPECPDNASLSKEAAVANMIRKNFVAEKIKCIKFDDWIEEHPEFKNIGFIKIDTQGAEFQVITGMSNFLKQAKGIYLVAEYEEHLLKMGSSYQQLDDLLLSLGFSPIAQFGNDKVWYKQ